MAEEVDFIGDASAGVVAEAPSVGQRAEGIDGVDDFQAHRGAVAIVAEHHGAKSAAEGLVVADRGRIERPLILIEQVEGEAQMARSERDGVKGDGVVALVEVRDIVLAGEVDLDAAGVVVVRRAFTGAAGIEEDIGGGGRGGVEHRYAMTRRKGIDKGIVMRVERRPEFHKFYGYITHGGGGFRRQGEIRDGRSGTWRRKDGAYR